MRAPSRKAKVVAVSPLATVCWPVRSSFLTSLQTSDSLGSKSASFLWPALVERSISCRASVQHWVWKQVSR